MKKQKKYKKTKLNSGLRIISVPIKNAKSASVLVLVGAGSKYETKDISGISHFLEHMFFKGTKNRPNTLQISETIDSIGGEYNAFTSKEITGFYAKVAKEHFEKALEWISDLFLNSKFEEKELEREKGVIIEELNMYLDTPIAYVSELWETLLYGDQPAGWRIVGEKETIQALNKEKLLNYFTSHYSASNTIICIAGDIGKGAESKVKKYFSGVKNNKIKSKDRVLEKQAQSEVLIHNKKTDQTHFCLGVRTFNLFDKRKYALALLAIILGGNMSSRLFIKVRERNGLAYSIHTSVDSTTDTGYLVTQAGINPQNLERAVGLILEEYKDIKNNKISDKELQKAKDYLKGTTSLSIDSSDSQASFHAVQELLEGKILSVEDKFKEIDKVSINDIKKLAEEIFVPEKLNLALIGPVEEVDKEKIRKLLKI
jgi:predicted Zn-dependent peptidase